MNPDVLGLANPGSSLGGISSTMISSSLSVSGIIVGISVGGSFLGPNWISGRTSESKTYLHEHISTLYGGVD